SSNTCDNYTTCFHLYILPFIDYYFYLPQRIQTAPQVKPPPKPTSTMTSSSLIFPSAKSSTNESGIEAADVLPYLCIVLDIFSTGNDKRSREDSIMRIFA